MKYLALIISIVFVFFILNLACNTKTELHDQMEKRIVAGKIDSSIAIFDTLNFDKNGKFLFSDSKLTQQLLLTDSQVEKSVFVIAYPPSTKDISWYRIGHAPNGSATVYISCFDGEPIEFTLNDPPAVAAISSLLQSGYARIDTISKEIYSYKTPKRPF